MVQSTDDEDASCDLLVNKSLIKCPKEAGRFAATPASMIIVEPRSKAKSVFQSLLRLPQRSVHAKP
jgi:hypothetical protein